MTATRRITALGLAAMLQVPLSNSAWPQQQEWVVSPAKPIGSRDHQLEVARRLMRKPRTFPFGDWTLLAESTLTRRLRQPLVAVARTLPDSYGQRLQIEPIVEDAWFLLFAEEDDYQSFRQQFSQGLTGATEGHAGNGLAATFVGDHTRDHMAALVIHESVHLLNRSTFADRLPTWLDEGLATSLSYNRVSADGEILLGTISSRSLSTSRSEQLPDGRRRTTHQIRLEGPMAALLSYSERPQDWPPLTALAQDWSQLAHLELLYPTAGFFVRYLLDGADRDTQLAFRALLVDLTRRPRPELISSLESRLPELEPGFRRWMDQLAHRSLRQIGPPGGRPQLSQ